MKSARYAGEFYGRHRLLFEQEDVCRQLLPRTGRLGARKIFDLSGSFPKAGQLVLGKIFDLSGSDEVRGPLSP